MSIDTIRENQKNNLEFIKYYKTALKLKWPREKLALLLGIKPKSLLKRVSTIRNTYGTPLQLLPITSWNGSISQKDITDFQTTLATIEDKIGESTKQMQRVLEGGTQRKVGTYVITSAQNATPINKGFFRAIQAYCDINGAQLLVIPYRYKNPTSLFNVSTTSDDYWAPEIANHVLDKTVKLCDDLVIIGSVKIQPTATEPLSGFEGYTGTASAIFGHPKIQQTVVPAISASYPKVLITTGAITEANYSDSKSGFKGEFHHSVAALVVEVTDTEFHVRHIHYKNDGFYDLDGFYSSDGSATFNNRIAALVTGDTHAMFLDKQVEKATYSSEDSICKTLRPEMKIFHDLTDFYSRNHHHTGNDLTNYAKHHFGLGNVERELQISADLLDRYNDQESVNIIVKSNHDEAFDRWLRESDPQSDPENAKFYYYMKYNQLKNLKKVGNGYETIDPFEFWCNNPESYRGLKCVDNTIFLKRDQSLKVEGVELSFHGDKGANGARGSLKGFAKVAEKCIIGHGHSPGIYEGAYMVGTSSALKLEYNSGPSSWMHTHAIVYRDGTRTLINIRNGKWRA